jgi:Tfp pilus assembly protein PilN
VKPVNLLPGDQRRRAPSEGGGKGAQAVVGALAVLLAMVAVYVLTSNTLTERQDKAAAASAEADRLEAEATAQANFSDFADIAETRLESVAGVAQTRFDWERLMREVSRIMPEGSWLQATDASVFGDPMTAGATTTPAGGAPTSPYASFVGCTPDQSDVAQIMVRLREVHRVEDVRLKESTQESTDSEASIDDCGSLYKFDVAVTFTTTAPVGEAPRGTNRVPASLGGGS